MRSRHEAILAAAIASALAIAPAQAQTVQPPGNSQAPNIAPRAPDRTLGFALMSATINADGSIGRATGVVSAQQLAIGAYEVIFERNIVDCTFVATANTTNISDAPDIRVSLSPRFGTPAGAFIVTRNAAGAGTDGAFSIMVFCWR
jgi:hypothetical protein